MDFNKDLGKKVFKVFNNHMQTEYLTKILPSIVLDYIEEKDFFNILNTEKKTVIEEITARADIDRVMNDLEKLLVSTGEEFNQVTCKERVRTARESGVLREMAKNDIELSIKRTMQIIIAKEEMK